MSRDRNKVLKTLRTLIFLLFSIFQALKRPVLRSSVAQQINLGLAKRGGLFMKMKHNCHFYIMSYILCCLSIIACPSPLSDTSESGSPSTGVSSECDDACQSDEVCHLGQCATPCGQLGEPCPKNFACTYEGFCVNYILDEVYVPAGHFWMGCNPQKEDDCDAGEQHRVTTPSYFIHRHEFTETMAYYCERGECPLIERRAQSTIMQITHTQAQEECARWGYELCSEAQWEKAAKGG